MIEEVAVEYWYS